MAGGSGEASGGGASLSEVAACNMATNKHSHG